MRNKSAIEKASDWLGMEARLSASNEIIKLQSEALEEAREILRAVSNNDGDLWADEADKWFVRYGGK